MISTDVLDQVMPGVVDLRRRIHQWPEPGWCEFLTTSIIRQKLLELPGVQIRWGRELYDNVERMGVPGPSVLRQFEETAAGQGVPADELTAMSGGWTGIVADIEGTAPGPTVGIRTDLDALPIAESRAGDHAPSKSGFASVNDGYMHACGHDGHASIAVGIATLLARRREQEGLRGKVRLLFQPAEEGTRGADALVRSGWLDDVDVFISYHISDAGGLRLGQLSPGVANILGTIKFDVEYTGAPAHYALKPQNGRNALQAAAQMVVNSQLVARRPGTRSMVNAGVLRAGTARNIVPAHAFLGMEVRSDDQDELTRLYDEVQRHIRATADAFGVEHSLTQVGYSPVASSDDRGMALARNVAAELGSLELVEGLDSGASDDAAAMLLKVQDNGGYGTYMKIGGNLASGQHTSEFDFDEQVLRDAVEVVTNMVATATAEPTAESPASVARATRQGAQ